MGTRNEVTRLWLSQPEKGWSRRPGRKLRRRRIPQEAKAQGNAWDRLTWGCHRRGHGYRRSLGFRRARLSIADRKPDAMSNSAGACAKSWGGVIVPKRMPMTTALVARSRMRSKVSRPVLNQG